ncbi:MAG: CinA-like protein [Bacteroidota bacterium]|nr:CinA-like protein [Bacteroidota bacterium]
MCIGQVVNTNAAWLASRCVSIGCEVFAHSVIGDSKLIIISELDRLLSVSDLVLTTGGLGPTHDDITKSVLCEYFDDKMVMHEDILAELKVMYEKRGWVPLMQSVQEQALLPSKCKPLKNALGSAPGMLFEKNGKYILSMPGVPKEMMYITDNHVLPFLKYLVEYGRHDIIIYKNILTTGVGESVLAELIGEPEKFLQGGTLAFLPSYRGVRLRIGISGETKAEANSKLEEISDIIVHRVGKYIYGFGDDSLSQKCGRLLVEMGKTISLAESCTGGMLGAAFTDIPGSSAYFSGGIIVYSNEAKTRILGVNNETIKKYGAVSGETASELAEKIRIKFGTDYGIGITGIAGPDGGSKDKPVGTVWIGISDKKSTITKVYNFSEDRQVNRERSVSMALNLLYMKLKDIGKK